MSHDHERYHEIHIIICKICNGGGKIIASTFHRNMRRDLSSSGVCVCDVSLALARAKSALQSKREKCKLFGDEFTRREIDTHGPSLPKYTFGLSGRERDTDIAILRVKYSTKCCAITDGI